MRYRAYSVRGLGMGNAYTAVVDNYEALAFNPAALNRIHGIYITLLGLDLGLNGVDTISDLQSSTGGSSDFVSLIRRTYGKNLWTDIGGQTILSTHNFAFSIYDQANLSAYMHNPAFPTLDVTFTNDYGFNTGLSFEAAPGLAVGVGVRTIQRTGGNLPVGVELLQDLDSGTVTDALKKSGRGIGVDLGVLYTSPNGIHPSFSFVWNNAGGVSFASSDPIPPSSEKGYMTAGFSAAIEVPGITITPAIDYRYLDDSSIVLAKKLSFGLEVALPVLSVRGGFHQGYYTAGLGVDLGFFRIEAATYGEELGVYAGQQEDRRYLLEFAMELGMDMDFSFLSDGAAGKRRLKQRR